MEQYRKKLQHRRNLLALAAFIIALIFLGLLFYREQLPVLPSFIKGFHQGAFIGIELLIVFLLSKNMSALKDDTKLKKMHIEESDERTGLIIQKASTLGMTIILLGICTAAIISGFFNASIFFTLVAVLFFVLIVFYGLWIYYAKKI